MTRVRGQERPDPARPPLPRSPPACSGPPLVFRRPREQRPAPPRPPRQHQNRPGAIELTAPPAPTGERPWRATPPGPSIRCGRSAAGAHPPARSRSAGPFSVLANRCDIHPCVPTLPARGSGAWPKPAFFVPRRSVLPWILSALAASTVGERSAAHLPCSYLAYQRDLCRLPGGSFSLLTPARPSGRRTRHSRASICRIQARRLPLRSTSCCASLAVEMERDDPQPVDPVVGIAMGLPSLALRGARPQTREPLIRPLRPPHPLSTHGLPKGTTELAQTRSPIVVKDLSVPAWSATGTFRGPARQPVDAGVQGHMVPVDRRPPHRGARPVAMPRQRSRLVNGSCRGKASVDTAQSFTAPGSSPPGQGMLNRTRESDACRLAR